MRTLRPLLASAPLSRSAAVSAFAEGNAPEPRTAEEAGKPGREGLLRTLSACLSSATPRTARWSHFHGL